MKLELKSLAIGFIGCAIVSSAHGSATFQRLGTGSVYTDRYKWTWVSDDGRTVAWAAGGVQEMDSAVMRDGTVISMGYPLGVCSLTRDGTVAYFSSNSFLAQRLESWSVQYGRRRELTNPDDQYIQLYLGTRNTRHAAFIEDYSQANPYYGEYTLDGGFTAAQETDAFNKSSRDDLSQIGWSAPRFKGNNITLFPAFGNYMVGISLSDTSPTPGGIRYVGQSGGGNYGDSRIATMWDVNSLGQSTAVLLDDFPGGRFYSQARDITSDGQIIVGQGNRFGGNSDTVWGDTAFIWDSVHGLRVLQDVLTNEYGLGTALQDMRLDGASCISASGRFICGYGLYQGYPRAWLIDLGSHPIHGTVELDDFGGDISTVPLTLEIFEPGGTIPIRSYPITLDENGEFDIDIIYSQTKDFALKGPHWLRKKVSNVQIPEGSTLELSFSLTNGDCDGDNEITLVDFGQLAASFGKALGDAGFDPNADLDGDTEVTLVDLGILASNFGESGD